LPKIKMNIKRLFYYLILNIIVSAATILIILNIWDRTHRDEAVTTEPVSILPTVIASALPPTSTPTPKPTIALRPYEVGSGETLGEIAQRFDTSIAELLEINSLSNPDELVVGMILFVPVSGTAANESREEPSAESAPSEEPLITSTPPPTPESTLIKIETIVGIDDLATEHLQIQSVNPEAISLEGWRLETNDGLVYIFPNITLFEYGAVDLYSRAGINSVVALYWGRSTPVFQSGDQAIIYDADGNVQAIYSIP
jgi:LysM repeat protein